METGRLETFADGVFAIAITLLVLGIGIPPVGKPLGAALLAQLPTFFAYIVSQYGSSSMAGLERQVTAAESSKWPVSSTQVPAIALHRIRPISRVDGRWLLASAHDCSAVRDLRARDHCP